LEKFACWNEVIDGLGVEIDRLDRILKGNREPIHVINGSNVFFNGKIVSKISEWISRGRRMVS